MKAGLVVAALLPVVVAGLFLAFPAAAAATAPGWYGFADLGDAIEIERAASVEQRSASQGVVRAARARVAAFTAP